MALTLKKMKICFVLSMLSFALIFSPLSCLGGLSAMSEKDMKASVAQAGFSEFSMSNDVARLFLDIHIESIATIGVFSAGKPTDWDLQLNAIEIGHADTDTPVTIDGLVFIADFDGPDLQRLVIGSNRVNGDISGIMNQYSGVYNNALTGGDGTAVYLPEGGTINGVVSGSDPDPGRTTFEFRSTPDPVFPDQEIDMGLFFVLTNEAGKVGFQIVSGYNEVTSAGLTSQWWDSP